MRKSAVLAVASIFLLAVYVTGVQADCRVGHELPSYAPPGEVMGMSVIDAQGKPLGRLENIIYDWETSRIGYGIVSYEGNSYYVPWSTVACNTDGNSLRLQVDQQTVLTSPKVEEGAVIPRAKSLKIHQHYGLSPYWEDSVQRKPRVPTSSPEIPSVQMPAGGPKK